jgi:putative transcriptional regulator
LNRGKASSPLCDLPSRIPLTRGCIAAVAIFVVVAVMGVTLATGAPRGTSAKSFFLVASHDMPDPVFQQSVILMLPPDEPPLVAGVIINKPTNVTLGKLLRSPVALEMRNQKVYFGGPVDLTTPTLVIRTSSPPKPSIQLSSDLYAVVEPSSITDFLKDSRSGSEVRLFLGRAQWAQEQLRGELLEGAWSVVPVKTDLIFEQDPARVWRILSRDNHFREIGTLCGRTGGVLTATMCGGAFAW